MPSHYFTADTHFSSENIVKYCKRPFKCAIEMNEHIIQETNKIVRPGDFLFHLGDVAWSTFDWKDYFGRLRTKECHVVLGNHDYHQAKKGKPEYLRSMSELRSITINKVKVFMCHYALRTWPGNTKGGVQLYGHSHNQLPGIGRQMDIGCDASLRYAPFSWDEIWSWMKEIPYEDYK